MGQMEEDIVESLVVLRDEEPQGAHPMFVFPLSLMASPWATLNGMGAMRCGDVARVSRNPYGPFEDLANDTGQSVPKPLP